MKIVIITGCLGFMGSYVTRKCLDRGWMVYGIDKGTYVANFNLLKEFEKYDNFKFKQIDIKDLTELYECDYVINFAAESHVDNSIVNSDDFISTNVVGVKNLLELIRHKNIRPMLLHISTDEVYGEVTVGSHTENDMLNPSNPYSAAKAAGDMLINAWSRTYGIDYIILRPTNNYGIGQYPEKLIPSSIKNLTRNKIINLHEKGTPVRNWLHASDTADAVMSIIDSNSVNEIYNVSGGYEQTNNEVIRKIINIFYGTDNNWEKYINYSFIRPGHDFRYSLDDSKLRSLGWLPIKKFDEEIGNIVDYYKRNFIW